jgi:hypothetical protein
MMAVSLQPALFLSQVVETPLVTNGEDIEVTNENKMGYVK